MKRQTLTLLVYFLLHIGLQTSAFAGIGIDHYDFQLALNADAGKSALAYRLIAAAPIDYISAQRAAAKGIKRGVLGTVMHFSGIGLEVGGIIALVYSSGRLGWGSLIGGALLDITGPMVSCGGESYVHTVFHERGVPIADNESWRIYGISWVFFGIGGLCSIVTTFPQTSTSRSIMNVAASAFSLAGEVLRAISAIKPVAYSKKALAHVGLRRRSRIKIIPSFTGNQLCFSLQKKQGFR